MAHAVENHPQKDYIVNSILSGVPVRKISSTITPALHYTTLNDYKLRVIQPAVRDAKTLAKVSGLAKSMDSEQATELVYDQAERNLQAPTQIGPYLDRIAKHQQTVDDSLTDARAEKDGRTVAALIGADLKGMELDARLTGRLDSGSSGTTNIYMLTAPAIVFGQPSAPEPAGPVIDVKPGK